MKRMFLVAALAWVPAAVAAQEDPAARLREVLPPDVAEQVVSRVQTAREGGLPPQAVTNLALEGVAKGRTGEEVLAAVDVLLADMGRARGALEAADRMPDEGEIEAATSALRMGVDGSAISGLARTAPSGRSLTVPLLVMGGMTQRGLPSDEALSAVRARLEARADDAELLSTFGPPAIGRAGGIGPGTTGPGAAGGQGVGRGRSGGPDVPAAPPGNAGGPPAGRGAGGGQPG